MTPQVAIFLRSVPAVARDAPTRWQVLRRLLKALLRDEGWRCVAITCCCAGCGKVIDNAQVAGFDVHPARHFCEGCSAGGPA